ncbi:MAG: hypothetical protein IKC03_01145, partial [Oscillospiraceae bacterium]|nr:hypothetical protein [Oscillospiraceae bacterium]
MKNLLLDILEELLYSAGIVVMLAIVAGGYIYFVLTRFDPNIVTIMYVENARDAGIARGTFINGILSGSGYTAMASSYDAEVIEQWMELTEEAVSEENATELRTYSAVFPCYIVVFKELSEDTKGRLQRYYLISEKE